MAARDHDTLPFLRLMPNFVTMLALCAGLTSIRFTMSGQYEYAAGLIIVAAVLDALDGRLARRLKAESDFGAELDSLADFLDFGVAPGLLVYKLALAGSGGLGWIVVLVYIVCCCMRLARFNVGRIAGEADTEDAAPKPEGFVGIPAPAGAMLALLPVFLTFEDIIDPRGMTLVVAIWLAAMGALMVSTIPTLSLKSIRIPRKLIVAMFVATAFLAGTMLYRPWLAMILLDVCYLLTVVSALISLRRKR